MDAVMRYTEPEDELNRSVLKPVLRIDPLDDLTTIYIPLNNAPFDPADSIVRVPEDEADDVDPVL